MGREGMRKAGEMGGSCDPTGCVPFPVCPDTGYRQYGAKSGVKGQGVYITSYRECSGGMADRFM